MSPISSRLAISPTRPRHLLARPTLAQEREADIVADGERRIERVALEGHGDAAVLGRQRLDRLVAHADQARGNLLEARDHPQRAGLAAARRAQKANDLAPARLEVDPVDREHGGLAARAVDLAELVEGEAGHPRTPQAASRLPVAASNARNRSGRSRAHTGRWPRPKRPASSSATVANSSELSRARR